VFLLLIFLGGHPLSFPAGQVERDLVLEGELLEPLWASSESVKLQATEQGVPVDLAASAKVMSLDGHFYLGVNLPEPGGRVLAYSVGYNPRWEKKASTYFFTDEATDRGT
jgi:hypothetical protein